MPAQGIAIVVRPARQPALLTPPENISTYLFNNT
jgi:hypothetical protein